MEVTEHSLSLFKGIAPLFEKNMSPVRNHYQPPKLFVEDPPPALQ